MTARPGLPHMSFLAAASPAHRLDLSSPCVQPGLHSSSLPCIYAAAVLMVMASVGRMSFHAEPPNLSSSICFLQGPACAALVQRACCQQPLGSQQLPDSQEGQVLPCSNPHTSAAASSQIRFFQPIRGSACLPPVSSSHEKPGRVGLSGHPHPSMLQLSSSSSAVLS